MLTGDQTDRLLCLREVIFLAEDTRVMLQQYGSTADSITLYVSGIVSARKTEIWLWPLARENKWVDLNEARDLGYLTFHSEGTNGEITVYFDNAADVSYYKVWDFVCSDVGSVTRTTDVLHALIGFEYQNEKIKRAGQPVDITWKDFDSINQYAMWMSECMIGEISSGLYSFTEDDIGEDIYADYLAEPIRVMLYAANNLTKDALLHKSDLESELDTIFSNVYSGAPFSANLLNDRLKYVFDYWQMRGYSVD